jgi:hypothetical protein
MMASARTRLGEHAKDVVPGGFASMLWFRGIVPRPGGSLPPPGPPLAIFPVRGKKRRHERPGHGDTWAVRGRYILDLLFAFLLQCS